MTKFQTPVRAAESDGRRSYLNAFMVCLRVFVSAQAELFCQWPLEVKPRPWGLKSFLSSFPRVPCGVALPLLCPPQSTKGREVLISIPGCQLSPWVACGRVENIVSGLVESGRYLLCK